MSFLAVLPVNIDNKEFNLSMKNFICESFEDLPENIQDQYNQLFSELVPPSGSAKTVGGEILRALSKLVYRYYNDGDRCFVDWTGDMSNVNMCWRLLDNQLSSKNPQIKKILRNIQNSVEDDDYSCACDNLIIAVVKMFSGEDSDWLREPANFRMEDFYNKDEDEPSYDDDEDTVVESEDDSSDIGEDSLSKVSQFGLKLLMFSVEVHLWHLNCNKHSIHVALQDLYDYLNYDADKLLEAVMGIDGKEVTISLKAPESEIGKWDESCIEKIEKMNKEAEELITGEHAGIDNILGEICEKFDAVIYKLKKFS